MEDFDVKRIIFSFLAFLVVVFFYIQVVLTAAVDVKKINDRKAEELRKALARKGIVIVDH